MCLSEHVLDDDDTHGLVELIWIQTLGLHITPRESHPAQEHRPHPRTGE